ncbi:hypothetical protein EDC19_0056 [Natranaerovirga hydrolytica]|uniref:Uncharacterized protein n=1 Tax=Natranaerovirga hydrolytica TaxID=680378 RepID=A0A4R1NA82_9FIRM|nr:hypothetical protein [Natranaerovirga hydrolytica]TCL00075.1 hypothetical protein EDC19_0056 [Natranaerovirga hydrolytica]
MAETREDNKALKEEQSLYEIAKQFIITMNHIEKKEQSNGG